jgi:hypothetical protein
MLVRDLKVVYDAECVYYRQEHESEVFNVWKDVLLWLDDRDVKRAISIWHADETEVVVFGDTRPRGAFMPKAVDIRSIVTRGKRQDADNAERFNPCDRWQFNVDVNGTSWPELHCMGGELYLHTTDQAGNSAIRPMRNCDCFLNWQRMKAVLA